MKEICKVTNKSTGSVVYKIQDPDFNVRRVFNVGETQNVKVAELEKLTQQPGGRELLLDYLMVQDEEVIIHLLNIEVPLEYWFTEDKLPSWMNNCSLDEFKDALDFAPDGTKDLIKKLAVSMPLNDYSKREAIKQQLGFDVSIAIKNSEPDPDEKKVESTSTTRRVQAQPQQVQQRRVVSTQNK